MTMPNDHEHAVCGEVDDPFRFVREDLAKQTRSILARLSQDQSFAALWKRLDQAERDRDRMLNALQLVRDEITKGNVTAKPRVKTIINRALMRVQPTRAE